MKEKMHLPGHIAFIMDGNGRWAKQRGLSRLEGHRAGVENARTIIKALNQRQIKYATIYAFSTENWNRPADEVSSLFHLLEEAIDKEALELHQRNVRILHLGRLEGLSSALQRAITNAVALTRDNHSMTVCFAFNYGGRLEIIDAVRCLMLEGVPPQRVDEGLLSNYLYTADIPDIDLVVRTGGEVRISNFMIWQTAYSELYFTPVLWPDFDEKELEKALLSYSQRQRRFGGLMSKVTE